MAVIIKSFTQLRKYFEDPKCLECEYSLRGLPAAGATCPECGAACGRRALADRICAKRWDRTVGFDTLLSPSVTLFWGLLMVVPAAGCLLGSLLGGWGFALAGWAALGFWILIVRNVVNDFGSPTAIVLSGLLLIAVVLLTGGVITLLLAVALPVTQERPWAFVTSYGWWGTLAGAAAALVGSWFLRGVVVRGCRSRCRALCEEWLAQSA